MSIEAMKQAVEAFEAIKKYVTDDGAMPENWDAYHEEEYYALEALRQAIEQAEKQEPVAWRSAAIRLGEELSSVGCDNYYNLTAEQWLDWALAQEPRGKNSLPTPHKEWVGLTDEEIAQTVGSPIDEVYLVDFRRVIEKLKERNI